jgi:hypothetical protein
MYIAAAGTWRVSFALSPALPVARHVRLVLLYLTTMERLYVPQQRYM